MTKANSYHPDYSHNGNTFKSHDGRYSGFWFGVDMSAGVSKQQRKSSIPSILRRRSSTTIGEEDTTPTNTPRKTRKGSNGTVKGVELPSPSQVAINLLSKIGQKRYYYSNEKPPQLDELVRQQQQSFQPVEFSPNFTFDYPPVMAGKDVDRSSTPPTASKFSQTLYDPKVSKTTNPNPKHSSPEHPCLHHAYEKAVKASSLTSSSLPAETILKHNAEVKAKENRERRGNRFPKSSKSKRLQIDWTKKMFVLVPGSSILQYSGDGSYDRTPERVLKLQAASLVFATDVLEGRHWVLQVNSNAEGVTPIGSVASTNPANQATSNNRLATIFGRLSSKASKLDSSVFLLVFENAEDMQDWMLHIRQEIANLGGPGVEQPKISSHHVRRLTKMSSFPTTIASSPTTSSSVVPPRSSHSTRASTSRQSRDDTPSLSTVASKDQMTLENLRRNNSFGSSRTPLRPSSPDTSPERLSSSYTDKRKSLAPSHRSRSSVDLRSARSSRPPSTIYDQENWRPKHTRTPSPSVTEISKSTYTARKKRESLHSSVPIPVPTTRRSSRNPSFDNGRSNAEILGRSGSRSSRPRTRRSSSHPASPPSTPKISIFPTIKPPASPVAPLTPTASAIASSASATNSARKKVRPVSLAAMPVSVRRHGNDDPTFMGNLGPSQFTRAPSKTPVNIKRRSMGALAGPIGPPLHPPPSVPLPKLPTHASSYYDLNRSAKFQPQTSSTTTPRSDRGRNRSDSGSMRKLNTRHSFHVINSTSVCT